MDKAPHMWVSLVNGPSLVGWQRLIHKAADVDTIIGIIKQVVGNEIAA